MTTCRRVAQPPIAAPGGQTAPLPARAAREESLLPRHPCGVGVGVGVTGLVLGMILTHPLLEELWDDRSPAGPDIRRHYHRNVRRHRPVDRVPPRHQRPLRSHRRTTATRQAWRCSRYAPGWATAGLGTTLIAQVSRERDDHVQAASPIGAWPAPPPRPVPQRRGPISAAADAGCSEHRRIDRRDVSNMKIKQLIAGSLLASALGVAAAGLSAAVASADPPPPPPGPGQPGPPPPGPGGPFHPGPPHPGPGGPPPPGAPPPPHP